MELTQNGVEKTERLQNMILGMKRVGRKSRKRNGFGIVLRRIAFHFSHLGIRSSHERAKRNPQRSSKTKTAKFNTSRNRIRRPFPEREGEESDKDDD